MPPLYGCNRADAWYIACVILGREFVWRKIERDESVIQMLIEVEKDFWNNNILAKKMPAPDGSEAADKILSEYYGKSDPEKVIPLIGFDEKLKTKIGDPGASGQAGPGKEAD